MDRLCFHVLDIMLSKGRDGYALRRTPCYYSVSVPVCLSSMVMPHRAQVVRVTFAREVVDERDARSTLTMLAQLAWERERNYVPVVPQIPDPVGT